MSHPKSSRLKEFYKKPRGERLDMLREFSDIPVDQTRMIGQDGALDFELTNLFIENAIGSYPLPMGIVTNLRMNGADYVAPFAVEESSVVAATSNAARMVYFAGGFRAQVVSEAMIGQIQILDIPREQFSKIIDRIYQHKQELIDLCNQIHPRLVMRGGGTRDLEVHSFIDAPVPFLTIHVIIDTRDAMGANLVNTACEGLAPHVERITGGRVGLRILSNFADRRLFRATCAIPAQHLALKVGDQEFDGRTVGRRIYEAFVFADADPYRAATHNKGIMNGIDPLVIATGNDWRAVEAGAHAYAARTGRYRSLSKWYQDAEGTLHGELEIPLQIGTVGGVTRLHPLAKLAMQILKNPDANTLGCLMACCGLSANLAALRALTTTGIQRGHMKLHAKNLALAAGASAKEVEKVAAEMVSQNKVSALGAETLLAKLRKDRSEAFAEPEHDITVIPPCSR